MTDNRTVIVTGASRGIGRATAIRLAQDFSLVVVVARNAENLHSTAAVIRAAGGTALVLAQDMCDETAVQSVVYKTLDASGRIDAVINIAGAVPQTSILTMTDAEWQDGMALKFHVARKLVIASWQALQASKGSVVFMSGTMAITPKPSLAAVSSINAAIAALAKAFSEQGIVDNIQVNSVLPGPVMTDRRRKMLENFAKARGLDYETAVETFTKESGITRFGRPEEIAALIAFAVSPEARWMTGSTLRMDGGEVKAV